MVEPVEGMLEGLLYLADFRRRGRRLDHIGDDAAIEVGA